MRLLELSLEVSHRLSQSLDLLVRLTVQLGLTPSAAAFPLCDPMNAALVVVFFTHPFIPASSRRFGIFFLSFLSKSNPCHMSAH